MSIHQRTKARSMARKHEMDGVPPMPVTPDMGPMTASPPMPQGIQNPAQVLQGSSTTAPQAPAFKRGGVVGGRK